ncbi:MAG TPA: accessory gene regulator B family protein [Clostridiales bacterium]|nr:accessory gene regulator B family protein [Clostridiales bacterium]
MEKIVKKLASAITEPLGYDSEQQAVVQYGLFAIIQIIIIGIIITVFGLVTNCLLECWISYLAVAILRKSTGGAHAKTSNECLIISVAVISVIGIISHYLKLIPYGQVIGLALCPLLFIISCFIVYKKAPVDSEKKPIKSPKKIRRLRIISFITLIAYAIISIAFIAVSFKFEAGLYLAVSLNLSVFWQSITLLIAVK